MDLHGSSTTEIDAVNLKCLIGVNNVFVPVRYFEENPMITQKLLRRNKVEERRVVVDYDLCFFCGACVAVCPPDSIFLDNTHLSIDHDTCTRCERCTHVCPVYALAMDDE